MQVLAPWDTTLGISLQAISKLGQSEEIEDTTLVKVATTLGVSAEAIKNYSDETVLSIISIAFRSNDNSTINSINIQPTFNPLDRLMEALEANKELYERLLASEREKVELLKNK